MFSDILRCCSVLMRLFAVRSAFQVMVAVVTVMLLTITATTVAGF